MNSFVKCLEMSDYSDISQGVGIINQTLQEVRGKFVIPHPHRLWEYGSAVQALMIRYEGYPTDGMKVLDVGSGWGPLGPALSYKFNLQVVEVEPSEQERQDRRICNQALARLNKKQLTLLDTRIENLPDEKFEAVFCISVLEHVDPKAEKQAWVNLAERVKPGGVLFVTMDCVPEAGRHYVYDELRAQNFTMDVLEERVRMLEDMGFTAMGRPDFEFKKAEVHDFTFFRCGMRRTE